MTAALASVPVELGDRRYDVVIGHGARAELSRVLPAAARRAVVVTQAGIAGAIGSAVDAGFDLGIDHVVVEIGRGEDAKTLATVEDVCRAFARAGLSRSDVVVSVGGGMVTDVAGFAAAVWHRGTAVVHVATTLLAQVDAAIGGKTAVNLPQGKNLVGAFWQPHAVICDLDMLATLPAEEWRSGYGEIAKCAFLGLDGLPGLSLEEQVRACVALKAGVVAADEREGDRRMILNYGHTLAHALEAAGLAADAADDPGDAGSSGPPRLRHGEAVAVGLVFAARLAEALGRIGPDRVREHLEVLEAFGLPVRMPAGAEPAELLSFMRRDKKATHGDLTFVLDGPHGVEPVRGADVATVEAVLLQMIEEGSA